MKYVVYRMRHYWDGVFPEFVGIYDEEQDLSDKVGLHQEKCLYFPNN